MREARRSGAPTPIRQATKWAAYQGLANGAQTPVGPGCEACYHKAIDILNYESFQAFLDDLQSDDGELSEKLRVITANMQVPGSSMTWTGVAARRDVQYELEISKRCVAYSETALKKRLNMTRLTNKVLHGIPQVTAPSLETPGEDSAYFLFQKSAGVGDTDDDGYEVRIAVKTQFIRHTELLEAKKNLHEHHALVLIAKAASDDDCGSAWKASGKRLMSLQEFADQHKSEKKARKMPEATPLKSLTGRAAAELELESDAGGEEEVDKDELERDLTDELVKKGTPSKRCPSLNAGGSGAGSGEEEEEDDDDDDEDMPLEGSPVPPFGGSRASRDRNF